ncbi:osmotically inducible protein OsmC [Planobispora rosea]|uniref:Osmotically inducible protein OsmC n=1 Tax=Planobispora rosea TaxID=35762 RepID=A0A8J3WAE7_PLARO|nr:OsmC family protein [Planobispora rosea]GGS74971.1 osmotically inducible protein OsmC [Planobispora rosea]GIH81798.1 osmotically inducible protein OsmC [Planobispora rosea]
MSTLRGYLSHKRTALLTRRAAPVQGPVPLHAHVTAEGRSGVRRIRIRDFQILSDSGPDFAGYDLGPGSPELQAGVLGSCVTHIFLIKAAELEIPLDSLEVDVRAEYDPRAQRPDEADEASGAEGTGIPVYPQNFRYQVLIDSPAPDEDLARLHAEVERVCPILNLIRHPQDISGSVVRVRDEPSG